MAFGRVGGGVAGGLALIVWLLDIPVPPCPPIATLPLRREPDGPVRAPETQRVWREIERGVYEEGLLRNDLTFTPTAEREPFRFDGIPIFGPPVWTLEEQQRGVGPWADATTSIRIPK